MEKTRNSLYNAISALLFTLTNGLLGIVVTRLVISKYGSDFNGLNSTANQIINVLLVFEGGFTLASNVALFTPLGNKDYKIANGVLNATKIKFKKIAVLFFGVGIAISVIYSFLAKTLLSQKFVFTVILMAVIPQAVNLYYTMTFRVLLQTQQKEYIISGFTALTIGAGHIVNIFLVTHNGEMWMVRFVTMIFALINCVLITEYAKRKNMFLDFSEEARLELIKGTNDVMIQKITGVIYTSWPIVFLSISSNGGTVLASVYAVYNNIFVMEKALLHGVIDAPRLSFGQLLTERKKEDIWELFKQYEMLAIIFTFVAMTTVSGVIMPFIKLYTRGVNDANYYDIIIATLMVLIGTMEMIHIPSGHLINMSGNFKVSKNFQIIACIVLITSMALLGAFFSVYGMLWALLIVAVLLAVFETGFIHTKFFNNKMFGFMKLSISFLIVGVIIAVIEMRISMCIEGWGALFGCGVLFLTVNTVIALVICLLLCKESFIALADRALNLIRRR
ncbi:MAG: hypothetical protein HFH54_02490 [Lachnospiraceae bacterium]|nr:hypothetical protein [Lachnospiraceae bacterium]